MTKCEICGRIIHPREEVEGRDLHGYLSLVSPYVKMLTVRVCGDCIRQKLGITIETSPPTRGKVLRRFLVNGTPIIYSVGLEEPSDSEES